jgi:hypothetical protein
MSNHTDAGTGRGRLAYRKPEIEMLGSLAEVTLASRPTGANVPADGVTYGGGSGGSPTGGHHSS